MQFVEFIEAVARVADKIQIPHYLEELEKEENANNGSQPSSILNTLTSPRSKQLDWKIEAYII